MPDKLTFRSEGKMTNLYVQVILLSKISNDTKPPDKLKGKITRLYIQYRHTVMDRKEQLTDRTIHKNKPN